MKKDNVNNFIQRFVDSHTEAIIVIRRKKEDCMVAVAMETVDAKPNYIMVEASVGTWSELLDQWNQNLCQKQ